MEVIDEWSEEPRAGVSASRSSAAGVTLQSEIERRLHGFDPRILTAHCYRELGHPWLHLVFDRTISPDVVLRAGDALTGLPGVGEIHLNSLRPRAVFFLFGGAADGTHLPARRYGEPLDVIRRAWQQVGQGHHAAEDAASAAADPAGAAAD